MALGDHPTQALEIANELVRDPDASPQIQFEAALIGAGAAYFPDRPGVVQALLARWKDPPMDLKDPVHAAAYANNLSMLALYEGDTGKVRQLEAHAPVRPQNKSLLLALAIGRTVVGWSHLWDATVSDSTCRTDARMKQASDLCRPVGLSISPASPTVAGSPHNISATRLPLCSAINGSGPSGMTETRAAVASSARDRVLFPSRLTLAAGSELSRDHVSTLRGLARTGWPATHRLIDDPLPWRPQLSPRRPFSGVLAAS